MFGDVKIKYLGFGSPLMDMIADVDENFIIKYFHNKKLKARLKIGHNNSRENVRDKSVQSA